MRGLRVLRAVARHERSIAVHLTADVDALKFYEYLSGGISVVKREMLSVPERTALHAAVTTARCLVEERFTIGPRVRDSNSETRCIVVRDRSSRIVRRIRLDQFPWRLAKVDLHTVAGLAGVNIGPDRHYGREKDNQHCK